MEEYFPVKEKSEIFYQTGKVNERSEKKTTPSNKKVINFRQLYGEKWKSVGNLIGMKLCNTVPYF